jgi:DNA-binding NarL/FixJ family response regulator
VVVQERRRLLRDGMVMLLREEVGVEVVGAVADGHGLVELCGRVRPDVAVIEVDAEGWDPAGLVVRLLAQRPSLRVVGVTDRTRPADRGPAGVAEVVARHQGWPSLLRCIRLDELGAADGAVRVVSRSQGALTGRELEVLELVAAGWRTKEVAVRLGISSKTVENHKRRIFTKLGVQNQAHAVSIALQKGFLAPVEVMADAR